MMFIRLLLGLLLTQTLLVGVWAQLAPKLFYHDFPALNWAWISLDGPYNEHLL